MPESSFFDSFPPIFGTRLVKDDSNYVRSNADRKDRRRRGVAGSYNHIVTDQGNLVSNERFVQMVENLGDAYETVEELYGMIWYLAHARHHPDVDAVTKVEQARVSYQDGLQLARETPNKGKHRGR